MMKATSIKLELEQIDFFNEKMYRRGKFIRELINKSAEYIDWKNGRHRV